MNVNLSGVDLPFSEYTKVKKIYESVHKNKTDPKFPTNKEYDQIKKGFRAWKYSGGKIRDNSVQDRMRIAREIKSYVGVGFYPIYAFVSGFVAATAQDEKIAAVVNPEKAAALKIAVREEKKKESGGGGFMPDALTAVVDAVKPTAENGVFSSMVKVATKTQITVLAIVGAYLLTRYLKPTK